MIKRRVNERVLFRQRGPPAARITFWPQHEGSKSDGFQPHGWRVIPYLNHENTNSLLPAASRATWPCGCARPHALRGPLLLPPPLLDMPAATPFSAALAAATVKNSRVAVGTGV